MIKGDRRKDKMKKKKAGRLGEKPELTQMT